MSNLQKGWRLAIKFEIVEEGGVSLQEWRFTEALPYAYGAFCLAGLVRSNQLIEAKLVEDSPELAAFLTEEPHRLLVIALGEPLEVEVPGAPEAEAKPAGLLHQVGQSVGNFMGWLFGDIDDGR